MKTKDLHTKAAARRSVRKERFGSQWVVVSWNAGQRIWVTSHPMDYHRACQMVKDHINAVINGDLAGYGYAE